MWWLRLPKRGAVAVAAIFLTGSALAGCGGGPAAVATWSDPTASLPSSTPSPTSSSAASGEPGPTSSSPEVGPPPSGPSQSEPTAAEAPGQTPPPPAGAQYRVVDSLCNHVSLNALTTVLPHVSVSPYEGSRLDDTVMTCLADLGATADTDQHGGFFITVQIFASAAEARASFDHYRGVNSGFASFADIPGVGDRAFQALVPYAVPAPTVRVQHGNAEFLASWDPLIDGPLPDGIFPALVQTIRATMTSLQSA